jgi:biopolymer transport protein ExbB
VGRREAASLERYINVIGTIAGVSPLLGLLGTVSGMIKSFNIISMQGVADPASLAGGISEALITTAAGLVVAIPTFVIYRYLANKADSLILEMEENSIRMVDLVKRED